MSDPAGEHRRSLNVDVLELAERLAALAQQLRALEPVDDEVVALATAMEGVAQKVHSKAQLAAELAEQVESEGRGD